MSMDRRGQTRLVRTDTYGGYRWDEARDAWVQLLTPQAFGIDAASGRSALRKAADAGMHFSMDSPGGIDALVVAPGDGSRAYVAMQRGVWRSDDGARHFTRTTLPAIDMDSNDAHRVRQPRMAVDMQDADQVWYGSEGDGLWRSGDGGRTWRRIDGVPDADDRGGILVWIDPREAARVVAAPWGKPAVESRDRGKSWSEAAGRESGPRQVQSGSFAPDGVLTVAAKDGLWSLKEGRWSRLDGERPGLPKATWAAVARIPERSLMLAVEDGGKLYQSQDDGRKWSRVESDTKPEAGDVPWLSWKDNAWMSPSALVLDPVDASRIWYPEGSGVWFGDLDQLQRSGRLSWISRSRGIEQLVTTQAIAPPGQQVLLANWDFGVHRKRFERAGVNADESGATHGTVDAQEDYSDRYFPRRRFNSAWSLDFVERQPSFVVANIADHRRCCNADGHAVDSSWSDDGGATWHPFATRPGGDASRKDPYAHAFGNIVVSSDDPDNMVWMPAGNQPAAFTVDRGRSWQAVVLGKSASAKQSGSFGGHYLRRQAVASDRVAPHTFYLMHSGPQKDLAGIWRTSDGGRNWSRMHAGTPDPQSMYNARIVPVPGRQGSLFFTTGPLDGAETPLQRSNDGGRTWSPVNGLSAVSALGFGAARDQSEKIAPLVIYAAGNLNGIRGVHRSEDDGRRWQTIAQFPSNSLDSISSITADRQKFGRIYLGFAGSGWAIGETTAGDCRGVGSDEQGRSVGGACFDVR